MPVFDLVNQCKGEATKYLHASPGCSCLVPFLSSNFHFLLMSCVNRLSPPCMSCTRICQLANKSPNVSRPAHLSTVKHTLYKIYINWVNSLQTNRCYGCIISNYKKTYIYIIYIYIYIYILIYIYIIYIYNHISNTPEQATITPLLRDLSYV